MLLFFAYNLNLFQSNKKPKKSGISLQRLTKTHVGNV